MVGSLAGFLPDASVYAGETCALGRLADEVPGQIDVTLDCKGVVNAWLKGSGFAFQGSWADHRQDRSRVQPVWINSHLDAETFSKRFSYPDWRRLINHQADVLCGELAAALTDPAHKSKVKKVDKLAISISLCLAQRIQVLYQAKGKDKSNFKTRKKTPSSGPFAPPPFLAPNKKDQLHQLVAGTLPTRGHCWQVSSTGGNNLCVRCSVCKLWVQQTYDKLTFARLLRQACIGQGVYPEEWSIHDTHAMQNNGSKWACRACNAAQRPAALAVNPKLSRPCPGNKNPRKYTPVSRDTGPPKRQSLISFVKK